MSILKNEKETIEYGRKLAKKLKGGDVLCLYGELGAGKTTLVKGIAEGMGIKQKITSPTFALMNVYEGERKKVKGKSLVHIDTYRLKDEEELLEIGAEDYIGAPDTITVIEWPEKLNKLLRNKKIISIKMEHTGNGGRHMDYTNALACH